MTDWSKTKPNPKNKSESRQQFEAMLKKMNPDCDILFAQPIEMRFNNTFEGTKMELSVKVFGTDYDIIEKVAKQIKGVLESNLGVTEVEFEMNFNHDALERSHVSGRNE